MEVTKDVYYQQAEAIKTTSNIFNNIVSSVNSIDTEIQEISAVHTMIKQIEYINNQSEEVKRIIKTFTI